MEQLQLRLMARLHGPAIAPACYVARCKTYREAVRMAWAARRVHFMNYRQLASEGGFYYQHVGDWLNPDDLPKRRDLPGGCITMFESLVGNTLVSQWLAARSALTVLEEIQATKAAA